MNFYNAMKMSIDFYVCYFGLVSSLIFSLTLKDVMGDKTKGLFIPTGLEINKKSSSFKLIALLCLNELLYFFFFTLLVSFDAG